MCYGVGNLYHTSSMFISGIWFFIFIATTTSVKYSCRDENNEYVDWFVVYKLPLIKDHKNPLVDEGKAYAYITSKENSGWTLSRKPITDKHSILASTLAPIYKDKAKDSVLYFLYNDQLPGKKTYPKGGHAKGAVLADKTGGLWLIHSVPRYPPVPYLYPKHHFYPDSGLRNGQSFMCITLKPRDLESVGAEIFYNNIHVYGKSIPKDLKKMYSTLTAAANGDQVDSPPWNSTSDIMSAGGAEFTIFAKSEKFQQDLYSDWVAPYLGDALIVQTWPNGRSHQSSTCRGRYRVENVEEITVAKISFPSTKDHSKWAISGSKNDPWVCIGDINKDDSQKKRGGGTVCKRDKSLWDAYFYSATEIEGCG